MLAVYYIGIKAAFLFSLVHAFVKFEPLQKHWLFLGLLYTAGVVMCAGCGLWRLRRLPIIRLADFLAEDRRDRSVVFLAASAV